MLIPLLALLGGLALLIWSADRFIAGAAQTARYFGMPPLLIGMVVVGFGTSAPEMLISLLSAQQGEHDIVFGNVIGSNLFNTLAVVAIAGFIQPMQVPPEVLGRDMLVMGTLTLSLFIVCYGGKGQGQISRWKGALLLATFFSYTAYLLITA